MRGGFFIWLVIGLAAACLLGHCIGVEWFDWLLPRRGGCPTWYVVYGQGRRCLRGSQRGLLPKGTLFGGSVRKKALCCAGYPCCWAQNRPAKGYNYTRR